MASELQEGEWVNDDDNYTVETFHTLKALCDKSTFWMVQESQKIQKDWLFNEEHLRKEGADAMTQ